ncbi:zinc finger matrin-type protein CG9776-like, partial [Uranotaenia lowii]|uniref:zinc finger matrin-type protein CG9776-like n=1 Tax=Uranotaenia lowii TaxID=190385 RepID=UPI00247A383C
MDDKREGKMKDRSHKSRSRSREARRTPSRSPGYDRRRRRDRSRSRSRDRRRRSPAMRRRRRSPSVPPPPSMQQVPPPPMIGNARSYMTGPPPMYDAYGSYPAPPPVAGPYMGDMGAPAYGTYDYGAPTDAYGAMMAPVPPMMVGQPVPPGDDYRTSWTTQPPPVPVVQETEEDKRKKEAAIALEVRNQRESLKKQRDDYKRRASALKRELKTLKQQRTDLSSGREPPSPTTSSFIKENDKLQSQIQNKISTIENVIDMLDGIIEKDKTPTPPPLGSIDTLEAMGGAGKDDLMLAAPLVPPGEEPRKLPRTPPEIDTSHRGHREFSDSPERLKNEVLETMKRSKARKEELSTGKADQFEDEKDLADIKRKPFFNYIYYDPELHWCSICDIFPKTAKDYLNHLHTEQHTARAAAEITSTQQEYPWRANLQSDEQPHYPDVPNKRTPIRGLQFFVPATAWYCKICDFWMGDLHCASVHLKSTLHGIKYAEYVDVHRNFEMDWMSDRQKAYERTKDAGREQLAST